MERMSSVYVKLFEWQRCDADVQRLRALLKKAITRGDPDEVAVLVTLLETAEDGSRSLLAEIDALRAGKGD
jgi:hypothetical protein